MAEAPLAGPPPEAGVLTLDRALVVRSWDAWLAAATGVPAAQACGHALPALFPELPARSLAPLRRAAETGTVEVLAAALHAYLIPCPPRQPSAHFARMQQSVTVSPLREEGELVGIVVRIEDVTARRDRERALAEQLRSPREEDRLAAAEAMSAADATAAELAGAFADPSWRVRQAAALGAGGDDSDAAAQLLTSILRERHRDLATLNAALVAITVSGGRALPRLAPLLGDPDEDVRVYVALALGQLGDTRAGQVLLPALHDESANVRFHVIEALGRLGDFDAVEPLCALAEEGDFFLAAAALDALAAIGDPTSAARVIPLLDHAELAPLALATLGRLGAEDAVAPLAARLADPALEAEEVCHALATLHQRFESALGDGAVVAALVQATLPPAGADRLMAAGARDAPPRALVRVAGWLRDPRADDLLLRALEDPEARAAAVDGLVARGAAVAGALAARLPRLDHDALLVAISALEQIGSPAALPALIELLDEPAEVAVAAVGALAGIGDGSAFEPLLARLDAPGAALRQAVVGALSSIGHPEMRTRILPLLAHPSPALREGAARVAGYFGYPEALEALLTLAGDPEEGVRRAAVEHLAAFDGPRVRERLARVLDGDTPPVRAAAARALALGGPEARPLVEVALADPDLWVRYFAARSAAMLALPGLAPVLAGAARGDAAVPVRVAAIEALDGEDAALEPLSRDPEDEVAQAALAALARGDGGRARLAEALESDDPAVQRGVLEALRPAAGAALADQATLLACASPEPAVVEAAIHALAVLPDGAQRLAGLCGEVADPFRRETCVLALARAYRDGRASAPAPLRQAGEAAALLAIEALARDARTGSARALGSALEHPSARVRRQAAHALERIQLREAVAGVRGRPWATAARGAGRG